jgi:hypothetical protein
VAFALGDELNRRANKWFAVKQHLAFNGARSRTAAADA